jgi:hypothetical protein
LLQRDHDQEQMTFALQLLQRSLAAATKTFFHELRFVRATGLIAPQTIVS